MRITYNKVQLQNAAEFIFKYNKDFCSCSNINSVDNVIDHIVRDMKRLAKENFSKEENEWTSCTMTGGWCVVPSLNDGDHQKMEFEILVDPTLMSGFDYDLVEEEINEND